MSRRRPKATSFERVDFEIPSAPAPLAEAAVPVVVTRPRPSAPSLPPDEVRLPRRYDPHDTGRLDTEFALYQARGPAMAVVVVVFTAFVVAFSVFSLVGLTMVVVFR